MYETNNRGRGLEYKADAEAYSRVSGAAEGYKVGRYVMRMPARDRYVSRVPIETREEAVEKYINETLIYGRPRA